MYTMSNEVLILTTVFLLSYDKIEQIAAQRDYDRYTKKLDRYTHLVTSLFAVLKGYDSLRKITIDFWARSINLLLHTGEANFGVDFDVKIGRAYYLLEVSTVIMFQPKCYLVSLFAVFCILFVGVCPRGVSYYCL